MSERWACGAALGLALIATGGCRTELGPCDEAASRQLVHDADGRPAYAGQALMVSSCGYGSFCHSEAATGADRWGAPAGLDFDLRLAAPGPAIGAEEEAAELARLRRSHDLTFAARHPVMEQVDRGLMPPPGPEVEGLLEGAPRYARVDPDTGEREPLPGLDTEAGRAILRNWLACGAPVVERTSDAPPPSDDPVGFVEPALDVTPLAPRWPDIHERLIVPRCASAGCHGAAAQAGNLDLSGGPEAARSALVERPARSAACAQTGALLVVPGDPDASLLLDKLHGERADGAMVCGARMPLGQARLPDASLDAVEQWIRDGALAE